MGHNGACVGFSTRQVGVEVGRDDNTDGLFDGTEVGLLDGLNEGDIDGAEDGATEGVLVG